MTHLEMLEKIWEQQMPDDNGHRPPIQYEKCGHAGGWRLYKKEPADIDIRLATAIVGEGSPGLGEAAEKAFNKLFPNYLKPSAETKGESDAEKTD